MFCKFSSILIKLSLQDSIKLQNLFLLFNMVGQKTNILIFAFEKACKS